MNEGRNYSEFTIPQLAQIMKLHKISELENVFTGQEEPTFDDAFISFDEKRLSKQLRSSQSRTIYQRDIKPYIGNTNLTDLSIDRKRRVGKECRSRWSPYH